MKRKWLFCVIVSLFALIIPVFAGGVDTVSGQDKENAVSEKKALEDTSEKIGEIFEGIIIYIGEGRIELKRGDVEMLFRFTAETPVTLQGKPSSTEGLHICERVRAVYKKTDSGNELISLDISAQGYCGG